MIFRRVWMVWNATSMRGCPVSLPPGIARDRGRRHLRQDRQAILRPTIRRSRTDNLVDRVIRHRAVLCRRNTVPGRRMAGNAGRSRKADRNNRRLCRQARHRVRLRPRSRRRNPQTVMDAAPSITRTITARKIHRPCHRRRLNPIPRQPRRCQQMHRPHDRSRRRRIPWRSRPPSPCRRQFPRRLPERRLQIPVPR